MPLGSEEIPCKYAESDKFYVIIYLLQLPIVLDLYNKIFNKSYGVYHFLLTMKFSFHFHSFCNNCKSIFGFNLI